MITYRLACHEDLPVVVDLHRKIFGKMGASFLPKLGKKCLLDLYTHILSINPRSSFVAQDDSNIVGFLVGVTDTRQMFKILPTIFAKTILGLYDLEIELTDLIFEGFTNMSYIIRRRNEEAKAELLVIAVDADYQGKGIGTRLVSLFLQHLEEQAVDTVQVLVDERWKQAQLFYERIGFERVRLEKRSSGNLWIMIKKNRYNTLK